MHDTDRTFLTLAFLSYSPFFFWLNMFFLFLEYYVFDLISYIFHKFNLSHCFFSLLNMSVSPVQESKRDV